ncbi:hypothetical protein [Hymenobacter glacieicola]|uniref:Uncharacterized protein n=1 Tax=Hymenobacter glacieicola TaxID=1562124 RepID=A0ABQ1X765_9BACT|nr:hypothetical protein [Hymenobacter glacieicola]GGG60744.1 hypothetical protein GCM10011378_40970 [Hymenobacter glacieicola]
MNSPASPYQESGLLRPVVNTDIGHVPKNLHTATEYKSERALLTALRHKIKAADLQTLYEALCDAPLGLCGPKPPRMGDWYMPTTPVTDHRNRPQRARFSEDTPAAEWHAHQHAFCQEAAQVLLQACEGQKPEFYRQAKEWISLPLQEFVQRVLTK